MVLRVVVNVQCYLFVYDESTTRRKLSSYSPLRTFLILHIVLQRSYDDKCRCIGTDMFDVSNALSEISTTQSGNRQIRYVRIEGEGFASTLIHHSSLSGLMPPRSCDGRSLHNQVFRF